MPFGAASWASGRTRRTPVEPRPFLKGMRELAMCPVSDGSPGNTGAPAHFAVVQSLVTKEAKRFGGPSHCRARRTPGGSSAAGGIRTHMSARTRPPEDREYACSSTAADMVNLAREARSRDRTHVREPTARLGRHISAVHLRAPVRTGAPTIWTPGGTPSSGRPWRRVSALSPADHRPVARGAAPWAPRGLRAVWP